MYCVIYVVGTNYYNHSFYLNIVFVSVLIKDLFYALSMQNVKFVKLIYKKRAKALPAGTWNMNFQFKVQEEPEKNVIIFVVLSILASL